jgi:PAS domain S-box-containing protein
MLPEMHSIINCIFFVSALQAGYFLVQILMNKRFGGDLFFMCSHITFGSGLFLYALQGATSSLFFSAILPNLLITISGAFFFLGIRRFLRLKKADFLFLSVLVLNGLLFVVFAFALSNTFVLSLLMDVSLISFVASSAVFLLRKAPGSIMGTARFLSATLFFMTAGRVNHIVTTFLEIAIPDFSPADSYRILAYFLLLAFSLMWTYGVILMNHQQIMADRREAEEHFHQVFELGPDMSILSTIADAIIVDVNRNFEEQTGHRREDVIGKSAVDLKFWADTSDRDHVIQAIKETGSCDGYQVIINKKDGTPLTILFSARMIYLNNVAHMVSVAHDITSRILLQQEVYKEKEFLKTTLLSIGDGVISTDTDGRIRLMNPVAENLTGWKIKDAADKSLQSVFHIVHDTLNVEYEDLVKQVLKADASIAIADDVVLLCRDGKERAIRDSASPIRDESGKVIGVIIVFHDFTEEKKKNENIAYLSYHDQMTGLYNRRFFLEELKRLDTERSLPLTLVMADINGLKMANDAFGHRL